MNSKPPILMRLHSEMLHRLPLMSGVSRLSFNIITNNCFRTINNNVRARLIIGCTIDVNPNDYDGRVLYFFGTADPKVHHVTQALLRPGDIYLDIGANLSSIGIPAADKVGPSGMVHLFEPQPELCHSVQDVIEREGLSGRIQLHRIGLWDSDGELTLIQPEPWGNKEYAHHSGGATFVESEDTKKWTRKQTVPVRNVATYLPPLLKNREFGAKLDVEGAEIKILPWLLTQSRLRFIIFEATHNQEELYKHIESSSLTLFGLVKSIFKKRIYRIEKYQEMLSFPDLVGIRLPEGVNIPKTINPYKLAQLLNSNSA